MTLFLDFVRVLSWPIVVLVVSLYYQKILRNLLPGSRVKFSISGVEFETSIPELERSVGENLRGHYLSDKQWQWLRDLRDQGRTIYDHVNYKTLRPLRNTWLIREHPEGTLTNAEEIEITKLGRLLINARDKR